MMDANARGIARRGAVAAVALLLLMLLANTAGASSLSQSFCQSVIPSGNSVLSTYASLKGLVGLSLIIMLTMGFLAGLAFMLGYVFRIDRLARFGIAEVGEILVTALVVLVFLGSFTAFSPPKLLTGSGAYNSGIFMSDCEGLANASLGLVPVYIDIAVSQDVITLVSSLKIEVEPEYFGGSIMPLSGYSVVTQAIGLFFNLSGALAGLLIGVAILMGVFYAVLPFFLFAGIVLRTLPVTRAAGGAFLGLFMAFYIFFPILLHFMLAVLPASALPFTPPSVGGFFQGSVNVIYNIGGELANFFSIISNSFNPTALLSVLIGILVDNFYAVIGLIIAFIISFDMMEAMGDLLGAPSLSSRNTLNRLL